MITRRKFLKTTAAGTLAVSGAGLMTSVPAWSKSTLELGTTNIDVLSDGNLRLPINLMMGNVPEEERNAFLKSHNLSTEAYEPACNLTLVRDSERTIIFDVGSGSNFMPSAGKLAESMEAMELDPGEVTHVVFTHAHPDHLWGLLDDFDEPVFSEAEYMISKKEWDYWVDPETVNTIGDARTVFAVGAKRNLMAIEDRITRFDPETEILPGVQAVDTAGHTPGHAAFEVRSGSESVMITGDAINNQYISFEKPEWLSGSDQDPEMGVKTRKRMLDQMASDKMRMIGFHMPYPGIGFVERSGSAYKFTAA